jgi:endogenous inhibitor of DNA gyrase (YacG/DUF329 family)
MACPICQKDTDEKYRPFCSKRCADIDLAKWLNEDYSMGAAEDQDDIEGELLNTPPIQ